MEGTLCVLAVLFITLNPVKSNIDVRCFCVCPDSNHEEKMYLNNNLTKAEDCTCNNVFLHKQNYDIQHCSKCTCHFEVRNLALIKVLVSIVLVMIFLTICYLIIFLYFTKNGSVPTIIEAKNDPSNINKYQSFNMFSHSAGWAMNQFDEKMFRWKAKVDAQRDIVYKSHTLCD